MVSECPTATVTLTIKTTKALQLLAFLMGEYHQQACIVNGQVLRVKYSDWERQNSLWTITRDAFYSTLKSMGVAVERYGTGDYWHCVPQLNPQDLRLNVHSSTKLIC